MLGVQTKGDLLEKLSYEVLAYIKIIGWNNFESNPYRIKIKYRLSDILMQLITNCKTNFVE